MSPGLTGADLARARALRDGLRARREAEAVREAWEERAAIMEEAERWAAECVQRVPGAVPGIPPDRVRLLVASGALRRAP